MVETVSFVKTDQREFGVKESISALGINPVKNKDVLVKPNFNTADAAPGSTHNDTLAALIKEIWDMGAKSISLGERSYPPTKEVMDNKGIPSLMKKLEVRLIDFDDLPERDWVEVNTETGHWPNGLRVARPILEAECLVWTGCLKTHQFGGVFTMALKLAVGVVPTSRNGFNYMSQLHSSPHQRKMIAEINTAFKTDLVVLDGVEAFVDGGPATGTRAPGDVFLASRDRVAVDAVGVAVLKHLGSTPEIMNRKIFDQEQIAHAAELGVGVSEPGLIEIKAANRESQPYRDLIAGILSDG